MKCKLLSLDVDDSAKAEDGTVVRNAPVPSRFYLTFGTEHNVWSHVVANSLTVHQELVVRG